MAMEEHMDAKQIGIAMLNNGPMLFDEEDEVLNSLVEDGVAHKTTTINGVLYSKVVVIKEFDGSYFHFRIVKHED